MPNWFGSNWGIINNRITISRLKYIRTDVSNCASSSAGTVIGEVRELPAVHQPEVVLDGVLASCNVGTEPGGVSGRAARDTQKVIVGVFGESLGSRSGNAELQLPGRRAAHEPNPLLVDAGDPKGTREVNLSRILNGGIDILEGTINIDVGEQARWLNRILSGAR